MRRLAAAAPSVAFRLALDGRTVFDLPGQDRAGRVGALFGAQAAAALLDVSASRELAGGGQMRLAGFAAAPSISRASAAGQSLVVNGRPVADPVLRTAIRVAYREVIEAGRHAVVALWLDLPPEELDVNVHPTKAELRFADPAAVRALVIGGLRAALSAGAGPAPVRPALASWPARTGHFSAPPRPSFPHPPAGLAEASLPLTAPPAARVLPAPPPPNRDHPLGAPLAQLLDTYILAVAADGALVLVDQHAAHERLTHEALRRQYLDGGVRGQPLLLPAVVERAPAEATRLLERAPALARLGLEIEPFGGGAVLVRALPAVLGSPDAAPLLRDLADELGEDDETAALEARLDAVIARMACHGSIRAGRRLDAAEMDALLRQMEATPRAATCSHGRPTFLRLSRGDIELLFGRR